MEIVDGHYVLGNRVLEHAYVLIFLVLVTFPVM